MSHAKQASTKRKRSINAVPVLSAAGLSLSLASAALAGLQRICRRATKSLFVRRKSRTSAWRNFMFSTTKMPERSGVA